MQPSADVLDCCEEAFLFDLAREDVWIYSGAVNGTARDAGNTPSPSSSSYSSFDATQHRRFAAVEWSTLQVVLRHAVRACSDFTNGHEIDNYIVSNMLDSKPMTASAVVAARERFVGKRVATRDLVQMVSRAGPLHSNALSKLKAVFSELLSIEKALAVLATHENNARAVVTRAEVSERRQLTSTIQRAQLTTQHATALARQRATQHVIADVYVNSVMTHRQTETLSLPYSNASASLSPQVEESHRQEKARVQFLNDVVSTQLCRSREGVALMREALTAAAVTLQSPGWCYEPLADQIDQYDARLHTRLDVVSENVHRVRASVQRLQLMQAGRRLNAYLAQTNRLPARINTRCKSPDDTTSGEGQVHTLSAKVAHATLTRYLQDANTNVVTHVDGSSSSTTTKKTKPITASVLIQWLFCSIAGLADASLWCEIPFPAFDYFAEFCHVYSTTATIDVRWRLFVSFASEAAACSAAHNTDDAGRGYLTVAEKPAARPLWFEAKVLSLDGFESFVKCLVRFSRSSSSGSSTCSSECAAAEEKEGAAAVESFLTNVLLPWWLTAPVFLSNTSDDGIREV